MGNSARCSFEQWRAADNSLFDSGQGPRSTEQCAGCSWSTPWHRWRTCVCAWELRSILRCWSWACIWRVCWPALQSPRWNKSMDFAVEGCWWEELTSFVECTWALWVPFNCLVLRSWSFASCETKRRSKFLLNRKIKETPLRLKYSATFTWFSIRPCNSHKNWRCQSQIYSMSLKVNQTSQASCTQQILSCRIKRVYSIILQLGRHESTIYTISWDNPHFWISLLHFRCFRVI